MAHSETYETVAGCRIRVMRQGSGTPVLLLHGAAGADTCIPLMSALAERHAVTVPEHPGFGASEIPDWLDTIADLAFFYQDFIDAAGLDRVHLVGASIGGWMAAELATMNASKLASLTLIAPAGIHVKGVAKGDMFLWSPEELVSNLYHDQDLAKKVPAPANEEELMVMLKNRRTTAKLGWQPRFYNPHLAKWLHRIPVPTQIFWGDDDKLIPPAYGPAYRDLIPGAKLHVFENCGHLPHLEKTADLAERIETHIEGAA